MGKCSFIQIGFWSIGTRPVIPIVIVDRHHVAIGKLTDGGGEITGYVAGIVGIIEVGILDIGYQDGHPAVLLPIPIHLGASSCPLFGGSEKFHFFLVHVVIKFIEKILHFFVTDANTVVPGISFRKIQIIGHPDFAVLSDGAKSEHLKIIFAGHIVAHRPLNHIPHLVFLGGGKRTEPLFWNFQSSFVYRFFQ